MPTVTMSVKLDSSDKDRLNRLIVHKNRSSHALAKAVITQFIEQEKRVEAECQEAKTIWQLVCMSL